MAKTKGKAATLEGGNPDFNLKDAKPVDASWRDTDKVAAPSAITAEDLALEAELERMSLEAPIQDIGPNLSKPLTKEKPDIDHLREHLDLEYAPAKTLNELEQQVALAKRLGCTSIDAAPEVIRYYAGASYSEDFGFFMYKDIRVCFPKAYEGVRARQNMTVEQKLFGGSNVK